MGAREPPAETTVDTLLRGRVTLVQPSRGFRSSLDPVLLAGFVAAPFGRFLDIGCGTGAVSLLLLAADPRATGVAVEIQPRLASCTELGRDRSGFAERLEVIAGDVRDRRVARALGAARFDLVATNPPFRPIARGQAPPDRERALAHHEVALSLDGWLDSARRAVRPGGRIAAVFPAERAAELLAGLLARGLSPTRLRPVHPAAGRPATRVLVEARLASGRPLHVEAPLYVHAGRSYSAELRRMLGELAD